MRPRSMRARPSFALTLSALMLTACGIGPEQPIGSFPSPDGAWTLDVTFAESNYPQGPWHVLAYLVPRDASGRTPILDTTLANDGIAFSDDNVAVRWVSSRQALICLRATDLPDRGLRVELGEPPRVIGVPHC